MILWAKCVLGGGSLVGLLTRGKQKVIEGNNTGTSQAHWRKRKPPLQKHCNKVMCWVKISIAPAANQTCGQETQAAFYDKARQSSQYCHLKVPETERRPKGVEWRRRKSKEKGKGRGKKKPPPQISPKKPLLPKDCNLTLTIFFSSQVDKKKKNLQHLVVQIHFSREEAGHAVEGHRWQVQEEISSLHQSILLSRTDISSHRASSSPSSEGRRWWRRDWWWYDFLFAEEFLERRDWDRLLS